MDPNNNFGAWLDEEAGEVYFDVSRIVRDSSLAVKIAYEENQKAIFDLMRGEAIELKKKDKSKKTL